MPHHLPKLRRELDRITIGTFRQHTEITKAQQDILAKLGTNSPPRIYQLNPREPLTSTKTNA